LVLGQIGAYFPKAELPKLTLRVWADELLEFDRGDVATGIANLARTLQRGQPYLSEIRDASYDARTHRLEMERQRALEAMPKLVETGHGSTKKSGPDVNREGLKRAREMLDNVGKSMSEG
jgi:hypothetical protein